jgi:hypothetical protein
VKTSTKLLLALVTIYPMLYALVFLSVVAFIVLSTASGQPPAFMMARHVGEQMPPPWFLALFGLHLLTMF